MYGTANLQGDRAFQIPFIVQVTWLFHIEDVNASTPKLTGLAQIVIAALLVMAMQTLPYSPRWLLQKGRIDDARDVMQALDKPGYEAEKEEALATGRSAALENNKSGNIFAKDVIGRTLWAGWMQAAQQLTGVRRL